MHLISFFWKLSNKFASQQDGNQATERSLDTYVESVFCYSFRCSYPCRLADIVLLSLYAFFSFLSAWLALFIRTHISALCLKAASHPLCKSLPGVWNPSLVQPDKKSRSRNSFCDLSSSFGGVVCERCHFRLKSWSIHCLISPINCSVCQKYVTTAQKWCKHTPLMPHCGAVPGLSVTFTFSNSRQPPSGWAQEQLLYRRLLLRSIC